MGFSTWIMSYGIVGAIAKDIVKRYVKFKPQFDGTEFELLQTVWSAWFLTHGTIAITGGDEAKRIRAETVMDEMEKREDNWLSGLTLVDVFYNALYVEGNVSLDDGELCRKAIVVFEKIASKNGLNIKDQCDTYFAILNFKQFGRAK